MAVRLDALFIADITAAVSLNAALSTMPLLGA